MAFQLASCSLRPATGSRPPAIGRDQAGVDQGAGLDDQAPGVELAVELSQQLLGQTRRASSLRKRARAE